MGFTIFLDKSTVNLFFSLIKILAIRKLHLEQI